MAAPHRSTFAREPDRPKFPAPSPPLPRRRLRQREVRRNLVLIADDAEDTRDLYAEFFGSRGLRAITARDGEEAVTLAISLRPDVIVMDLKMPRLDGVAATRRLKQDPRTRGIPIIVLTGYADKAIDKGALEAGAAGFLTKPCLPDDLEAAVRRVLDGAA